MITNMCDQINQLNAQLNMIPHASASSADGSGGATKIAKKVEMVPDPGMFSGSYAKYDDW